MTSQSLQHRFTRIASATGLAFVLVCASSAALADGGSITSLEGPSTTVSLGDSFIINVYATKGSKGVNCKMSWRIENADKKVIHSGFGTMTSPTSADDATAKYSVTTSLPKEGTFTLFAGPSTSAPIYERCTETKTIDITVKDQSLPSSTPAAKVSPSPTQRVSPGAKAQGLVNGVPVKP